MCRMLKRVLTGDIFVIFSIVIFLSIPVYCAENPKDILPGNRELGGWEKTEEPEYYKGNALFGYIDGGAEIFLQYRFRELFLSRYVLPSAEGEKEVTLEVYRMESPEDAFGIFSVRREGDEKVSEVIDTLNCLSETQVNLVKGEYFVNVFGFDCKEEELEEFAALLLKESKARLGFPQS